MRRFGDSEKFLHLIDQIRALSPEAGIRSNVIVGFPGETWDEIRETIRFAEEYDADYSKIFIATPLPNTELYRIAKKEGSLFF
jgi:tRNA A37 methylthiotransferase MiaB